MCVVNQPTYFVLFFSLEVYLNTLAVITETDGDNIDDCWPESFNYCSTFTKLLEDEK